MVKEKLLDKVRYAIRVRHLSYRTEEAYLNWIKKFILFHNKRHPVEMREAEVSQFLTYLAVNRRVASSTQNQALSAILFLYRDVKGDVGSKTTYQHMVKNIFTLKPWPKIGKNNSILSC